MRLFMSIIQDFLHTSRVEFTYANEMLQIGFGRGVSATRNRWGGAIALLLLPLPVLLSWWLSFFLNPVLIGLYLLSVLVVGVAAELELRWNHTYQFTALDVTTTGPLGEFKNVWIPTAVNIGTSIPFFPNRIDVQNQGVSRIGSGMNTRTRVLVANALSLVYPNIVITLSSPLAAADSDWVEEQLRSLKDGKTVVVVGR